MRKNKLPKPKFLICGGILVVGILVFFLSAKWKSPAADQSGSEVKNLSTLEGAEEHAGEKIVKESTEIFQNKDALYAYVKEFGPKQTIEQLHKLSSQFGSCHDSAHRAGRFSYEIYKEKAFKECSAECHSGCYHGATEAYFKEHGTANLEKNLSILCGSELNPFFSHQCLHGVGHGLMAWTDYELFDALESCNLLSRGRDSCWTGVFMENIVGTLGKETGHTTKYLSNDPQYPCTIVPDKYKGSCYFLQTSRMMSLFSGDFARIAKACAEAPEMYRRTCFESMGRDVGGTHRKNPEAAIRVCLSAPEGYLRIGCLVGAVQDAFWDPSGQDNAIRFCALLQKTDEKDACYRTIFGRAPQVLATKEELRAFCKKAEPRYEASCAAFIR